MGFGMEIIFVLMLGRVSLGSKRLHTGLKSQLAAELEAAPEAGKPIVHVDQLGD